MPSPTTVLHYDSFSSVPNMGNPAGVVLRADGLTEDEMQSIAKRVGFNETSFVMHSDTADYRIRFFTPGHEMPLCGHGTIACTLAVIDAEPQLVNQRDFLFETLAGDIEVSYQIDSQSGKPAISMVQAPATFIEFTGDKKALTDALQVSVNDLHPELPIVYGNTGTWTLLVPTANKGVIKKMVPSTENFPKALLQMPRCSIHPFALDTIHPDAQLHARHFSSPYSGTIEDPVTGTASGVMGAYMAKYSPTFFTNNSPIVVIEQGFEMGRNGRVTVELLSNEEPYVVKITGSAVRVGKL